MLDILQKLEECCSLWIFNSDPLAARSPTNKITPVSYKHMHRKTKNVKDSTLPFNLKVKILSGSAEQLDFTDFIIWNGYNS